MSCECNNATPPGPAIAPGIEQIDLRRAAEEIGRRGIDPRIPALVPGFDAPFFQAGLCGYSDAAMRIIARRHGCPFCVTEALLDRTLLAGGRGFAKADLGELEDNVPGGEEDHPLAGQIMGSDPREMAAAALKMVEQGRRTDKDYRKLAYAVEGVLPSTHASAKIHLRLPGGEQIGWYDPHEQVARENESGGIGLRPVLTGSASLRPSDAFRTTEAEQSTGRRPVPPENHTFQAIDVNLACPVKKIDRKARGGHWLADPDGAIAILEAVREAVPPEISCTVKLRRSYDDTPEMAATFERVFDAAYRMGYAWATVHARTVQQKYVGPSRWDLLRGIVRRHPEKVIFGSGDVWEASDIVRMIAYTGVHAVSVARGCIGNPWIFRQARQLLAGGPAAAPTIAEQRSVLEEHFALALAVNRGMRQAEAHTGKTMRKFGIKFAAHHPRADDVRRRMIAVGSLEDWRAVLDEFYTDDANAALLRSA